MQPFIHLHTHSYYSILDGQAPIQALVDKALADGMGGIALTDHGVMYGVKELFNYFKKKKDKYPNFKPIFGCEVYVARNGRHSKKGREDQSGYHLVLLAKNKTGYHNLVKLVSLGWMEGFYMRPRIDKEILKKYSEGLIVSSACLGGEIPRLIQAGQLEKAEESILWFKNLFGEDYYLEIQRHKAAVNDADHEVYERQKEVNVHILELAKKLGVKVIATNDVHFVDQEDADAHDHLLCVSTGKNFEDQNRMRYTKQEWLKSQKEMNEVFADVPEALANTIEILDKIEIYDINSKPIMPDFPLPEGFSDPGEYLRFLTYEGAKHRYPNINDEIQGRIDFELDTILSMGFPGYFLIVQDFIKAGRDMGVSVGPGRGSAAGSAVAYCLGITDIDPIKYDLLFERFLNPDRISMPDIDIDFDDDGRARVLEYVTNKYGKARVAHIVTFGTMATKSSLKDVARVQGLSVADSDRLTKLVPDKLPDGKKINLKNAIDHEPLLQEAVNSDDPRFRNTMRYAQKLEGTVRNTGVHACGVIIGKDDLYNYVPIATVEDKESDSRERVLVAQYEGSMIEDVGMLKMDFLGLKTLSIIKDALENIELTTGVRLDISTISLEDEKTYQLYSEGQTTGTFQFESAGMQKYLRELKPSKFEDLIAMNALYRPGPMDYIPSFIARKHGQEPITYEIPAMERYLKDTYGITVYQEQVMLLSRELADFTRGQSDELRKAMGKKLIDKMNALKEKFMAGTGAKGYDPKTCEKIWADWEKFASYAFNKSHATCYSWVAYQTAYLKANYPSEYMAAVLSRSLSNVTDIEKFMAECSSMKIQVLGPDINESAYKFSVNKEGNIRFGLGAIKGVGESAVNAIVDERRANGPFTSIFDLIERVNLSQCNKRNIENLALAGAFDSFPEVKREHFFTESTRGGETFTEQLVKYGNMLQNERANQANTLFGEGAGDIEIQRPIIPQAESWSQIERLNKEKELVQFYISAHPLDPYEVILRYFCRNRISELKDKEALMGKEIIVGGMVTSVREGTTKNGNPFGVINIQDYEGMGEIFLLGKDYIEKKSWFTEGYFLLFKGRMEKRKYGDAIDFKIHSIELLSDVKDKLPNEIDITLYIDEIDRTTYEEFKALIKKGNSSLAFHIKHREKGYNVPVISTNTRIEVTKDLIDFMNEDERFSFAIS